MHPNIQVCITQVKNASTQATKRATQSGPTHVSQATKRVAEHGLLLVFTQHCLVGPQKGCSLPNAPLAAQGRDVNVGVTPPVAVLGRPSVPSRAPDLHPTPRSHQHPDF
jgi:hypothetical protein